MDRTALIRRSRLGRRLRLARWALWWESRLPHLLAMASLAGFGLAAALFDAASRLPAWLHLLVLAGFGLALIALLVGVIRLPAISDVQAARRLEDDAGLAHRPLAALDDRLAQGDEGLWRLHLERMERLARNLRPRWPRPVAARADPHAIRFAALLLVVLAALGAGSDKTARLGRALHPDLSFLGLDPQSITVWVTPPAYTGLAARTLRPGDGVIGIPTGSRLDAVLVGGWGPATLDADDTAIAFGRDADGSQRAEALIEGGEVLAIRQLGRRVARWDMDLIPDMPPEIAIEGMPELDDRGRFRLRIKAGDDYGLARLWLEMVPTGGGAPQEIELDLPAANPHAVTLAPRLDLADHDWAGRAVRLIPHARDGAGHLAPGKPLAMVLPERRFSHPVARQLIAWRGQLAEAPRLAPEIAQGLARLLNEPPPLPDDNGLILGLALAKTVLQAEQADIAEARALLWAAAARLEDGTQGRARQELEDAKRELDQALAQGADRETLAQLLARYEMAVARRLNELAARSAPMDGPSADSLDARDLGRMLDELGDLAETADADSIRQRLDELQRIMDGLEPAPEESAVDAKAMKDLENLRDLARRQQDLMDQSFRQAQELDGDDEAPPRVPGAADKAKAGAAAQAQRALRDAAKAMGNPDLDKAARAMDQAAATLGKGEWGQAAEHQAQALTELKQGAAKMMAGLEKKARGKGRLLGRDPLGRGGKGKAAGDDGATRIPGQGEMHRAREILDELRRRAGDHRRPEAEMDYLHRLLKSY